MVTFIRSNRSMKLFSRKRSAPRLNHSPMSNSGKAQFVRQITHDIKGDFFGVTSVCLMLRLANEKKEDPETILEHLTDACEEYKYKLNNYLEYTKYDAGLTDSIHEPVNIRGLLGDLIDEVERRARQNAIRIDLHVSDQLPRHIFGDEHRLKHIVENMLVNAIQFSAPGGQIELNVGKKGFGWFLTVQDHGNGMTAEQLESVFKSSPAERKSLRNPNGLGLLVVRYLVEDVLKGKMLLAGGARGGLQIGME